MALLDNYSIVDTTALGDYVQEDFLLLVPRSLGVDMKAMIDLLRSTVTVNKAGATNLGILYNIDGKQSDIQALIDLGCMEWE